MSGRCARTEGRNHAESCSIIARLASNLKDMLNIKELLGTLMQKAVTYLQAFWKQLTAWRNDSNYSIDNNVSDCAIRPIILQRKASLQFGSKRNVEITAIYHTMNEICKHSGLNPRAYLKIFFQEITTGRTDFENLLPATIGRV